MIELIYQTSLKFYEINLLIGLIVIAIIGIINIQIQNLNMLQSGAYFILKTNIKGERFYAS